MSDLENIFLTPFEMKVRHYFQSSSNIGTTNRVAQYHRGASLTGKSPFHPKRIT